MAQAATSALSQNIGEEKKKTPQPWSDVKRVTRCTVEPPPVRRQQLGFKTQTPKNRRMSGRMDVLRTAKGVLCALLEEQDAGMEVLSKLIWCLVLLNPYSCSG